MSNFLELYKTQNIKKLEIYQIKIKVILSNSFNFTGQISNFNVSVKGGDIFVTFKAYKFLLFHVQVLKSVKISLLQLHKCF
jgi:hypothetical protein